MADLEWKTLAPGVEEAFGPNGARFIAAAEPVLFSMGRATAWIGDVQFVAEIHRGLISEPKMPGTKAACQRLADWASGTKREGVNRG